MLPECLRVCCVFALMVASQYRPLEAICGIVVLGLSGRPDFWDRFGSVATITAGGLAVRFRRP